MLAADQAHIDRAAMLSWDRLRNDDANWRIARRQLDLLVHEPAAPISAGLALCSVLGLADRS